MIRDKRFFRVLVVLYIIYLPTDAEDLTCPPSNSGTTYVKLKDAVLCNYDSSVRPVVNHQNSTSVSFKLILKFFDFDILSSTFKVDAWLSLFWRDQHLTWKPSDHDNIKNIYLYTYQIWTPDLSVYNLANQGEDPELISTIRCMVNYNGVVLCVPPIHMDVLCVPNLSKYPFDKQDCKLRIGSWMHKGEEIDIVAEKNVVNVDDLIPNGEWEILSHSTVKHKGVYACCPNNTYPSVDINFTIRRLAGSHAASMVIPVIVCVILTLMVLTLSPVDKERLIMSYVNILCHFTQVQYVAWQLPLKGDNMPLISKYKIQNFTNKITRLKNYKGTIPTTTADETAAAKGEEDGATIVNSNTSSTVNTQDWELFGKLLDKIFFVVYILTYFIMIISFLP
uniref:Neuronal acetylcholine receptor subunit alpha-7-like n=1 Tax=Diabrotica virgifera virgifera TaxID=50390 RepID=A0A6P7GV31_DIAVI